MEILITRTQAKEQGLIYFFTGIPCKNNHIARRRMSDSHCYECDKIRTRNYYHIDKLGNAKKRKSWDWENPEAAMFRAAKRRAKRDDVPFSIKIEDIIIPDFCPVLGIKLEKGTGVHTHSSPSLDKLKPHLGYVPGNISVISNRANTLKRDASSEELHAIAEWMNSRTSIRDPSS